MTILDLFKKMKILNLYQNTVDFFDKNLKNYMIGTTAHGIRNAISAPNKLVRAVWFACLISATGSTIFFLYLSISNYLSFNVLTYFNTLYEHRAQFPTLSVCGTLSPLNNFSILKCEFNRDDCNSYIEYYKDQYYDRCFRFNGGINISNQSIDILSITVGGYRYGLTIDLNIESNLDFNELVVFIHNYTFKPTNLRNKGIRVSTGSINYFQIVKTINEKLEAPYSECLKDPNSFKLNKTIINYIRKVNNSYSQVECVRLCRNLINMEQSGCNCAKNIDMPVECETTRNETVKKCYDEFIRSFQKKDILEICSIYCPLECDSINYSIDSSTEQLPVSGLIKNSFNYMQFKNYEQVQKHFISLRFFYPPDLKYFHIKEQPSILVADLVSQLGGTLGLFLGLSFLSFIELIEILIDLLTYLREKTKENS